MRNSGFWIALVLCVSGSAIAFADDPPPDEVVLNAQDEAKLCAPALTVCVDRNGSVTASDSFPSSISVGDKLSIVLITQHQFFQQDSKPGAVSVNFSSIGSLEVLFPTRPNGVPAPLPQPNTSVLLRTEVSGAVVDDTFTLRVVIKGAQGTIQQYSIAVDHGFSYYSVALLVAAVPNGTRTVNPNLTVTADYAIDPALALNIFPGGRERGYIGYARIWHGKTAWARFGRWLANNVGVQIGAGLDLTNPTDKLFGGVVFEPVLGLAFVGGVSLRKVSVVPDLSDVPLSGPLPAASRHVLRGYLGVTMTLDLLQTISSVGSSIKGLTNPL